MVLQWFRDQHIYIIKYLHEKLRLKGSEIRVFFMLHISGNPETTDLSRTVQSGIPVTERYQTNLLIIIF